MKEDLMFCHLGNGVTVCDQTAKKIRGLYESGAYLIQSQNTVL